MSIPSLKESRVPQIHLPNLHPVDEAVGEVAAEDVPVRAPVPVLVVPVPVRAVEDKSNSPLVTQIL